MGEGADGTQGRWSKKTRTRPIVAAAVGALVLLVALPPVPGILLRRRERAAPSFSYVLTTVRGRRGYGTEPDQEV